MIGKDLISIAKAIANHEGWITDDLKTPQTNEESIAVRNNNPGNLSSSPFAIGNRGRFAYFINEEIGWFALYYDLWKKCLGQTATNLSPKSTLGDLIAVYAPPTENNTERYIEVVEKTTGIDRDTLLENLLKK